MKYDLPPKTQRRGSLTFFPFESFVSHLFSWVQSSQFDYKMNNRSFTVHPTREQLTLGLWGTTRTESEGTMLQSGQATLCLALRFILWLVAAHIDSS